MDDIDLQRLDPPRDVKILRHKHRVEEGARGHVREADKRGNGGPYVRRKDVTQGHSDVHCSV